MKSFNINRFSKTLCWVLSVNYRSLLTWTIGGTLMVFLFEVIMVYLNAFRYSPQTLIVDCGTIGAVLFVISCAVMVCSVVSSINKKRKRESFLMLPSTNAEKYLALLVYTSVICVFCVLLALVAGDSLRMAWFWGRDMLGYTTEVEGVNVYDIVPETDHIAWAYRGNKVYWYTSSVPQFLYVLTYEYNYYSYFVYIMRLITIFVGLMWTHSLYTLGGTLLQKYSFVITSLVLIVCVLLFAKTISYFELSVYQTLYVNGKYIEEIGVVAYIINIVLPLLSLFNYWASFHIFKRFELITNKWLNYDFYK